MGNNDVCIRATGIGRDTRMAYGRTPDVPRIKVVVVVGGGEEVAKGI